MAYAMLSSLPPICGLYISFFGPLVYFFLGTSKHVSMGCISIVSLMIASVLDDALSYSGLNTDQSLIAQNLTAHAVLSSPEFNMSSYSQSNSTIEGFPLPGVSQGQLPDTPITRFKIELASALSLISGITMIILGRFGFGIITTYMPEPMVSGFTSAVAVQIITAQAKHIFGLDVVLMSLRGMFLQYTELPSLWRKSKIDFMIWIVTAASTIILDAEIGIIIGIVFSVFTVIVRTQRTDVYKAGMVEGTNIFKSTERYQPIRSDEGSHFVAIHFHGPVYFANAEHFMRTVYKKSGLDPKVLRKAKKQEAKFMSPMTDSDSLAETEMMYGRRKVVIDFTTVNFVDLVGVKTIKRVYTDYQSVGVDLLLVGCNDE
uniref:STAS domain-containing protein n=1 Tax=Magallana gigas TaxID=29159 RepID=A0A8W8KRH4_MAGGI